MDPLLAEWLNILVRWGHLIAGISWIGASFYFVALDLSLRKAPAMPHIVLAQGRITLPLTVMTPLAVSITGLALLRGEGANFQVLRRWPLNFAQRQQRC